MELHPFYFINVIRRWEETRDLVLMTSCMTRNYHVVNYRLERNLKQSSKEMETIYEEIINEIEAEINKFYGSLMVMVVISCMKPYMLVT